MNQVFYIKFWNSGHFWTEHNFNVDNKFSSEILNLYFKFVKFKVGKVALHSPIVPNLFFNDRTKYCLLNLN